MSVTIKDLAIACNLSAGTVSRALNGHNSVHPETITYVKEMAKSLGYYPNRASKALSARKNPIKIGILLPILNSPFFDDVKKGMLTALREYEDLGLTLKFAEVEGWHESEHVKALESLIVKDCKALCVCSTSFAKVIELLNNEVKKHTPLAYINHQIPEVKPVFFVGPDFYKSGFLAANAVAMCCRGKLEVLVVLGLKCLIGHQERAQGFIDGLNYFEVDYHVVDLVQGEDNDIKSQLVTMDALKANPKINCVYIATGSGVKGACSALISFKGEKPFVVATDEIPTTKDFFLNKVVDVSICQSPLTQGYHVIKKLYQKCTTNMSHEENLIIEPSVKLIGHYLPMPIHAK